MKRTSCEATVSGAILVLVAGLPGTGKSYLCTRIRERFPGCTQVSIDDIKERLWEEHGFDNAEQKQSLDRMALGIFFQELETALSRRAHSGVMHDDADGPMVLSDYPFSVKQLPTLRMLCERHGATALTIRLTADLEVLFARQQRRDLDPSRHLGHIVDRYHRGDSLPDRSQASGLLSREEFYRRCTTRGYDTFRLGDLLEVDATDLEAVDHEAILDWIARRS
ncbi:AAA family ATPase [Actinomyces ruminis]|uniref:Kinase n=1 Tax=Actinomyces ruminis TaxID=1937003 RepID=A0ABX4MDL8_9ACTO|nr:AAA family ATPase [Actinomyces ruminis]PHP53575.1 kinase [Actinomyces ruminis]